MALKYYLVDNPLSPDPKDRMAVSHPFRIYTIEDVIDEMISRGSTVTKAEALSVMEELWRAIEKMVVQGGAVSTPLFKISSRIAGVFESDTDVFDSSRHTVKVSIESRKRLRNLASKIDVEKTRSQRRTPSPEHFVDTTTGSLDQFVTLGGVARLSGRSLRFDQNDSTQGIFFIDVRSGVRYRVPSGILENTPTRVLFIIPPLVAGTYKLEVCALFRNATDPKTGVLPAHLSVS